VALQSRRPLDDAGRQLAGIAAGGYPTHLVVIGLGRGDVLDAIDRWPVRTRVLAIEPDPDLLGAFLSRRDWTPWLADRRLQIVVGPDYADGRRAIEAFGATSIPPVTVHPVLAREASDRVLAARMAFDRIRYNTPLDPREPANSQSMLHHSVLVLLEHTAAMAQAGILEIGSYIGGSTMAIGRGLRQSPQPVPFWTLEKGIAHPTHPHLPTDDSFAHLQRNLRQAGLERYATLIKGWADAPDVVQPLQQAIAATGLSLLLIDADGDVDRDFNLYLHLCRPGRVAASRGPEPIRTPG
jgi:predicted O-methyltransferase YrrM